MKRIKVLAVLVVVSIAIACVNRHPPKTPERVADPAPAKPTPRRF